MHTMHQRATQEKKQNPQLYVLSTEEGMAQKIQGKT